MLNLYVLPAKRSINPARTQTHDKVQRQGREDSYRNPARSRNGSVMGGMWGGRLESGEMQ